MRSSHGLLTVIVSCSFPCVSASAAPFHSAEYGYSLEIPDGWALVSKQVLDSTMGMVIADDAPQKPIYDAAFQLDSALPLTLQYPYLLTQVLPYSQYGLERQIYENEFDQVVQAITGLDVQEAVQENVSDFAKGMMNQPQITAVKVERERRRYLWDISMELIPYGKIKGRCVGYFGRDSIMQLAFYSSESDWSQYEPVASAMFDSFKFDQNKEYDETIRPSIWARALQGGARGGVIGGMIGGLAPVVFAAFRRRKA